MQMVLTYTISIYNISTYNISVYTISTCIISTYNISTYFVDAGAQELSTEEMIIMGEVGSKVAQVGEDVISDTQGKLYSTPRKL